MCTRSYGFVCWSAIRPTSTKHMGLNFSHINGKSCLSTAVVPTKSVERWKLLFQWTFNHTVQLMSKLTLVYGEHSCVLQFLSCLKSKHAKWAAHESTFVYCTRVIIRVMHDSKKHTSNASYTAHESVFLCVACKLTAIFYQRRIKAYNEKAPQQNVIKCVDTKIIFCQVLTYPYSNPL